MKDPNGPDKPLLLPAIPYGRYFGDYGQRPAGGGAVASGAGQFRSVLDVARRRWRLIALITLACLIAALLWRDVSVPKYTATARVLLSESQIQPFGREYLFQDISLNNPEVDSQLELIRSPFVLTRLVERSDLHLDPRLMEQRSTPLGAFFASVLAKLLPPGWLDVPETQLSDDEAIDAAVEILRENLSVGRDPSALVLEIRYKSDSRHFAAEIANAVAETYVRSRILQRQAAAANAATWFDERIAELETRASEAEINLARMRTGIAPSGGGATGGLASLQASLRDLVSERLTLRSQIERIETALKTDTFDALVAVSDLLPDFIDAEDLRTTLDADRADLQTALRTRLRTQFNDLQTRLDTVNTDLGTVRDRIADMSRNDQGERVSRSASPAEMRALESEARIYRTLYESYFESYLKTVQQQSFPDSEALIIQSAEPPKFSARSGLLQVIPTALLLGAALGLAAANAVEAMDTRLRTPGQMTRAIAAPYLGLWPRYDRKMRRVDTLGLRAMQAQAGPLGDTGDAAVPDRRIVLTDSNPEFFSVLTRPTERGAQTLRRVSAQFDKIVRARPDRPAHPRVIGFLSDRPLSARTVVASNYATMQAAAGKRVVLIDLDWKDRALSRTFAPNAETGLAELLEDTVETDPNDHLFVCDWSSLRVLPNRAASREQVSYRAYDNKYQDDLIARLFETHDEVVLDITSLSTSSDAETLALSGVVDAFAIVADYGGTSISHLTRAIKASGIPRSAIAGGVLSGGVVRKLNRYGIHV